jgi:ABC-type antimicrobial peptide transport system permease subunit
MQGVIHKSLAGQRLNLWLLAIFAGIALVLSAAGLYGVISYLVAQRTREIGVRIALGAQRRDVIGLVMRQGTQLTALGVALGLAGALAFTRVLERLLFGISARDPLTFGGIAALLAAVALTATWLAAGGAGRSDPGDPGRIGGIRSPRISCNLRGKAYSLTFLGNYPRGDRLAHG